ncbi:MAG TPA: hypothetical protein VKV80_10255, partial [Streptosporangiaceae bacterium]|nr:hypothetical protein [Streptosporangiaceae bacterium]
MPAADDAGGEAGEGFVDAVAAFPAEARPFAASTSSAPPGTRLRPGLRVLRGTAGNNGSSRSHRPPETIPGGDSPLPPAGHDLH